MSKLNQAEHCHWREDWQTRVAYHRKAKRNAPPTPLFQRCAGKALRPILILRGASVGAIYACVVELCYALMRSAQLNLPAALIAGSLFAATHVAALSIYLSLSTKAK